ncbi:uncharacterized protein B0I36DRAFT_247341 [Microdochium trichocladiopsis]|uniref:Fumarylacetoacetase n=1 Tax=Microdochium trichocladiopsis TaxID=1682393 RepID=A0A9P9BLF0_9PEZI|nr:uncharacterized protein B0I36DRAFT_247341 [Microdochium trichocladiopsis]KAH7028012.1 hypothetical protein B0I36DRAFT_247341 [Microdochium trichocladiopsis]
MSSSSQAAAPRRTWVPDCPADSPFSLANIPFGIIRTRNDNTPRPAIAIGNHVLDLRALTRSSSFPFAEIFSSTSSDNNANDDNDDAELKQALSSPTLNAFAALGRPVHRRVRTALQALLETDTPHATALRDNAALREEALLPKTTVRMNLPMSIGDYTDFYAGYHHAYAVGCMFRGPENALQPNYTHLPVGYHGRASSIVVSGTPISRPKGQILLDPAATGPKKPVTGPCRRLDFELELGCLISRPNAMGEAIKVDDADEGHIFGYVLLNDWSARDIQSWEYVPLGPFNSKNFGSTLSPWVVLADALEPFRCHGVENPVVRNEEETGGLQDYLREKVASTSVPGARGGMFDIRLEVDFITPQGDTTTIGKTSASQLMWSFPQMIAHHTLGGCPLRTGDLLGSGTISGPGAREKGSLLEMTEGGKKEIMLAGMEVRTFLKDGDAIVLRGDCGAGVEYGRVGFGECVGRIQTGLP